ncbi:MAG: gas vesicle protein [Coprothermobacterota bacterium]|nr:gas vesicle protein [Coprothermobacterota bacterium]
MEPTRNSHATLVDLLDRVLDKGLVINADLIISVAGIPLIGVNLRAALAGMETMLKYGVMKDWDARTRVWESEHRKKKEVTVVSGEEVILEMFGSYYYNQGIYTAWRTGRIYLTGKRLIFYHSSFEEVLFETPLEKIKGMALETEKHFTGKERENLCLLLESGDVVRLHALDTLKLKEALEQRMSTLGLGWEEVPGLATQDERTAIFLSQGEEVICSSKMWYLMSPTGIMAESWKPGHLYLTNKRLCWWYDFERKVGFEIPLAQVVGSTVGTRDLGVALKRGKVLDVVYHNEQGKEVASFSGENLAEWEKAFNRIASGKELAPPFEMETCPQCGREAPANELLEKGCNYCGWVSPRLKRQLKQSALDGITR